MRNAAPATRKALAAIQATPPDARPGMAREFVAKMDDAKSFDPDTLDALLVALPEAGVEWALELPSLPAACYVRAHLWSDDGNFEKAADEWERLLAGAPSSDPRILHDAARAFAQVGRYSAAASLVREMFHSRPPYSLYVRTERLVGKLWEHVPPRLRQSRIALLGGSTTSLLVPVLRALCFRDGIQAEFYEAPYGSFRQEILDPQSSVYRFQPDIAILITHWRDLDLPPVAADEAAEVGRIVADCKHLWRLLSEGCRCHIIHHAADFPQEEAYGYLSNSLPGGRRRVIALANLELTQTATSNVSLLDTPLVAAEVGLEAWSSPSFWHTAKQHPAPNALPALAEAQMAHIRSVLGLTRKVAICDLDNTLWGGVIGEDGLSGIQIGPGSAEGEAFADFQRYLLELRSRGILLAACSKNNPEDARLPFVQHQHMLLKLEDFAAFAVNWQDKATNLRSIAEQLALGTDSFVFLDDNPVERAWIRAQMPEVAVVELGDSPFGRVLDLYRGHYFDTLSISQEDRKRADLYRVEAIRESIRQSATSLEDFLRDLAMRGQVGPVTPENIARVSQLTNKTNQFNLTTRRYTPAEIKGLSDRPDTWLGVFQLEDRFGSYGIVGLIFCVPGMDTAEWEIDTWLMSCRVLGRQFEHFMLDRLIEAGRAQGKRRLAGVYRKTSKNTQVANLFPRFGFTAIDRESEEQRFVLSIDEGTGTFSNAIQLAVAGS